MMLNLVDVQDVHWVVLAEDDESFRLQQNETIAFNYEWSSFSMLPLKVARMFRLSRDVLDVPNEF